MLVMRNFGYLGLHSVVDSKSSLARDRLVDYTGELQVRRRKDNEETVQPPRTEVEQLGGYKMALPDWHPQYVSEPTANGGRFTDDTKGTFSGDGESKSYAQELLPLPLQVSLRLPSEIAMIRAQHAHDDIEPFYYTTFCNELLCQPRILHGYPKGNVVVKVELRDVEWNEKDSAYVAHLPSCGPSVHNRRRGQFLVQSSFSSCTSRRSHQFMDEFKIKLPLDLKRKSSTEGNRNLSILFTLFKIKLGKGWKRSTMMLFGTNSSPEAEAHGVTGPTRLEQIGCGFLPLSDQSCLLENGLHDIRIAYKSTIIPDDENSILLKERIEDQRTSTVPQSKDDLCGEELTVSDHSLHSDKPSTAEASGLTNETGVYQIAQKSAKGDDETMTLSVRLTTLFILPLHSVFDPNYLTRNSGFLPSY